MAFGNAQSATGSNATPTATKPTGTASNDIVIAANTYDSSSLTNTWNNSLTNLRQDTNTLDGQRTSYAWKRAGGSEPSSYTSTINSGVTWAIGALNFTGRSTTSDPAISTASVNNSGNSSPVTITANGVTAVAGDDLVWIAGSDCTDTAGPNVFTPPTGYTTRVDIETGFCRLMIATKENVSAGATGNVSGTLTLSAGTSAWSAALIRIPAAATSSTITAASGSFTLTGNAAGLTAQRKMATAQATYTLTGTAAALVHGYTMVAASGSFTLTGNAAGITAQRKVTAAQATFTETGNAAGLAVQRKLAAAQASFTLTGVTAGLAAQRKLTAAQAAYTLTGVNVTLTYTPKAGAYTLVSDFAAFVLTGNDAALTYAPITPPSVAPAITPAGASSNRRRYVIAIDGQDFIVSSQAEAVELLQRARAIAERQVEKLAETTVRKLKRKRAIPKVAIPAPAVSVPQEFRADLAPLIADIERLYRQAAVNAEIRLRLAQFQAQEDDDEDVLLLM